jgi:hypothetical protein
MRKLLLIAAIALVTVAGASRPSSADLPPNECLLCTIEGEYRCYVVLSWPCEGPAGYPECSPAETAACLGW